MSLLHTDFSFSGNTPKSDITEPCDNHSFDLLKNLHALFYMVILIYIFISWEESCALHIFTSTFRDQLVFLEHSYTILGCWLALFWDQWCWAFFFSFFPCASWTFVYHKETYWQFLIDSCYGVFTPFVFCITFCQAVFARISSNIL